MKNLTIVSLAVLFFTACSVLDKEEVLPSFVKIDDIFLDISPDLESFGDNPGSDRTDIKEVQVTANGQTIGIFSLPTVVPILESGTVDLIITPIIDRDGVSTTKVPYPFYDRYRITETLTELDTIQLSPVFTYLSGLTFWTEDFTDSSSFEDPDSNSEGDLVRSLTDPYEPPASGFIDLPSDANFFYAETVESFPFQSGRPAFLEMHYSSNHPFRVGALARVGIVENTRDLVGINPTTETEEKVWNKIYINITEFVADFPNSGSFEMYLRLTRDSSFPEPLVFIDNVKVVYQD